MAAAPAPVLMDPSVTNAKKAPNVYAFNAKDIDGNMVELSKYKDQVLIIVNVASFWGKTNVNYTQLQAIYDEYAGKKIR